MKKPFKQANDVQKEMQRRCIEAATYYSNDRFTVTASYEQVYEYKGQLCFVLSVEAKPNTGLLCLCNKSWIVEIGRRGQVKSKKIIGGNTPAASAKLKVNKHIIFI